MKLDYLLFHNYNSAIGEKGSLFQRYHVLRCSLKKVSQFNNFSFLSEVITGNLYEITFQLLLPRAPRKDSLVALEKMPLVGALVLVPFMTPATFLQIKFHIHFSAELPYICEFVWVLVICCSL